jgi:trk system potassium uptake protein TrkA
VELRVPAAFDQKTVVDLDLRNTYGVTLLALSQSDSEEKFEINPSPVTRLRQGTVMVVIGSNKGLDRLPIDGQKP